MGFEVGRGGKCERINVQVEGVGKSDFREDERNVSISLDIRTRTYLDYRCVVVITNSDAALRDTQI